MKVIYSPDHSQHHIKYEVLGGEIAPCFENPSRAERVAEKFRQLKWAEIVAPSAYDLAHITAVHAPDYVHFLQDCWPEWQTHHGPDQDALPYVFPQRGLEQRLPQHIDGKLGYYAFDLSAGICAGSWAAIKASADCALSAAEVVGISQRAAFALCRPPGHHASADLMGGYCYLNNAAIAAQFLRLNYFNKVAIVDVDYHHGNGTQAIFYDRDDVLFTSIHGDPEWEYPHFLGYADETGIHHGEGYNLNCPLPLQGTDWHVYSHALNTCLAAVAEFDADCLVVSLGLDTYSEDPMSGFDLQPGDYLEMGALLEGAGLPTVFVFEGGYALDELAQNTANVLQGFNQRL
jgi:acetoin utilization deacetylase AcuC-like enzyme